MAEVETDKVTTEIPSPKSGKVVQLKFEEGDVIEVDEVFIVIDTQTSQGQVESSQDPPQKEVVKEETAGVVGQVIASSEEIPPSTEGQDSSPQGEGKRVKVLATPVARKLAKDLGIDITTVKGTGPKGRVMKEDIKSAAHRKQDQIIAHPIETSIQKPKAIEFKEDSDERVERIPLNSIRKTISKNGTLKFTIPTTAWRSICEIGGPSKEVQGKIIEWYHLTYLPLYNQGIDLHLKGVILF